MELSQVIVFAGWSALMVLAFPRLRRAWNGTGDSLANITRIARSFWPYSEAALQGWVRAQVALYIGGLFMEVYPAAVLVHTAEVPTKYVLYLIALVGVIGMFFMAAVAAAIVFFNVPKRLVFPPMRSQHGLLRTWRDARRRRSERRVTFSDTD